MSRSTINSGSGLISGPNYMDNVEGHLDRLYNNAAFLVTSVGGTGDATTGTIDADFYDTGLQIGMMIKWIHPATNTGGVTLTLTPAGGSALAAIDVLTSDGSAMVAGNLALNQACLALYNGSDFILLSQTSGANVPDPDYQVFTASGTWTKPVTFNDDAMVIVELWGAGGGGCGNTYSSGGGGGQYIRGTFRLGDLGSAIAVTIGAGGSPSPSSASAGGDSSFGSLMTAKGGGGGQGSTASGGDLAGGTGGRSGEDPTNQGTDGGSYAASGVSISTPSDVSAGGGGGGAQRQNSVRTLGGTSQLGGNGGDGQISGSGSSGTAPGGGGGATRSGQTGGSGARGECRAWIVG